jgi:tripartite-type tricarboxylate transporter receptor subunit TctC
MKSLAGFDDRVHGFFDDVQQTAFLLSGVHISQVNSGPNVLVVNTATPFKSVKDTVDYAKAHPGKLDYGFTHAASGHMAMELFKQTTGIYMTGILYRGGDPMLTDLLGGTIPMMFITQAAVSSAPARASSS